MSGAAVSALLIAAAGVGTSYVLRTTGSPQVALDPAPAVESASPLPVVTSSPPPGSPRDPPSATERTPAPEGRPGADESLVATPAPPSASPPRPVPYSGPGVFKPVNVPARTGDGDRSGGVTTFRVELEDNLPFPPVPTANHIVSTLNDQRGWSAVLGVRLVVTSNAPDLRVLIATPTTTDRLCAPLQTRGRVSCRNGDLVVINAVRWARGVPDYGGRLSAYRRYVVNHEVGHALGQSHDICPGPGRPAPVMQQQTYGLQGCRRNPWPTIT